MVNGRLELFRNFDWYGNRYSIPRTLLIDSQQLESGEKLSDDFRKAAADQIERFRRERVERTGNREEADKITEQELLREVMNTVGKEGRLGQGIRCVVSVSMLTEGWDANNVTHVLGVRAFGTQLLCEQVVGQALRRQSYDLNDDGKFNVEYADVPGIPFDSPPARWLGLASHGRQCRSGRCGRNATTWKSPSRGWPDTVRTLPRKTWWPTSRAIPGWT